jgi:predicted ester cyclase
MHKGGSVVATLQRKNVGTPRGTHQGVFQGIPPTGRPVTLTGISIWRVNGGTIVESWHELDTLGLIQQLGVIPTPGQAG